MLLILSFFLQLNLQGYAQVEINISDTLKSENVSLLEARYVNFVGNSFLKSKICMPSGIIGEVLPECIEFYTKERMSSSQNNFSWSQAFKHIRTDVKQVDDYVEVHYLFEKAVKIGSNSCYFKVFYTVEPVTSTLLKSSFDAYCN